MPVFTCNFGKSHIDSSQAPTLTSDDRFFRIRFLSPSSTGYQLKSAISKCEYASKGVDARVISKWVVAFLR